MNVRCCWAGSVWMHSPILLPELYTSFLVSCRRCCITWFMAATRLRAVGFIRSSLVLCFYCCLVALWWFSRLCLFSLGPCCADANGGLKCLPLVPFVSVVFLGIVTGTANWGCAPAFCFRLITPWCLSMLCSLSLGLCRANTVSGWRCLTFVSFCGMFVLVPGTSSEVCAKHDL